MRKILLFLFLPFLAQAQWAIPPRTLNNNDTVNVAFTLQSSVSYRWVVSLKGPINATASVASILSNSDFGFTTTSDTSQFLRIDSMVVNTSTGYTDFTLTITGDSLQNWYLPDDSGSIGTPGRVIKAKAGWFGILRFVAKATGNGGSILISDGVNATYSLPPDSDSYAYANWVANIDYVTPAQLSDSLDSAFISGVATLGVGDSVRVVSVSAKAADIILASYAQKYSISDAETAVGGGVFEAGFVTLYGVQGRKVYWMRRQ